jgi:hypothetical protein
MANEICQGGSHDQENLEALRSEDEAGRVVPTAEGGFMREQICKEPITVNGLKEFMQDNPNYAEFIKTNAIQDYLNTQRSPKEIKIAVHWEDIDSGKCVSLPNNMKNIVLSAEQYKAIIDQHIKNRNAEMTTAEKIKSQAKKGISGLRGKFFGGGAAGGKARA